MRLFCEHVLGTGPFDDLLRHNGRAEAPIFPDGFAASALGGAFGMIAALHGPVEEQARLSIHPHMLLWFISTTSEARLRNILGRETEEASKYKHNCAQTIEQTANSTARYRLDKAQQQN